MPELEVTNFVLQYCLRKDSRIIQVKTISAHTYEELLIKMKCELPSFKIELKDA